jgi:hypothetical protein
MKNISTAFLLLLSLQTKAQNSRFVLELTDKKGSNYSLSSPLSFLSSQSIERKKKYNISIDSADLPVSKVYIDSILRIENIQMIGSSKWMNFVVIQTNNQQSLQKIQSLGFVKKQYPIAKSISSVDAKETDQIKTDKNHLYSTENTAENLLNYGKSLGQISIHNGEYLHNKGFTGSGIKIAVFDAGFFKYQTYDAFDSLRKKDKIKYTWDFVSNHSSVNEDDPHGMSCLSIMGANLPGRFVGSAPGAEFYLFRTEDARSEYPIEEVYWLMAAESADSIGVDIISSSLGYTTFDNSMFDHVYSDLNGTGTIVSKAASTAVSKGMIVTSSAGNEGDDPWKYISAPADGKNVLAVGAINTSNQIAPFSGFGPSADGRTKPDIVSVGFNTQLIASDGNVGIGNGTSFSNPNIAGLIACLWQSFPEFNNLEIIQAIKQSSHQYLNPDNRKGYGIPNMQLAHEDLNKQRDIRNAQKMLIEKNIAVYPNPINSYCKIAYKPSQDGIFIWRLVNTNGQTIMSEKNSVKSSQYYVFEIKDLSSLSRGVYFLLYSNGTEKGTLKIIK